MKTPRTFRNAVVFVPAPRLIRAVAAAGAFAAALAVSAGGAFAAEDGPSAPVHEGFQGSSDAWSRVVTLELVRVAPAKRYEVEIRDDQDPNQKPLLINTEEEFVQVRLRPGNYRIRTRSLDQLDQPGDWSAAREFAVHYRSVTSGSPAAGEVIVPRGDRTEVVHFEWPTVPGAAAYRFRLKTEQGKMIKDQLVESGWVEHELKVGAGYRWSLTPVSRPDELVKEADEVEFSVAFPPTGGRSIQINAPTHKNESGPFEFQLTRLNVAKGLARSELASSREPVYRGRLEPGEYFIRAREAAKPGAELKPWFHEERFFVPYFPPARLYPRDGTQLLATDPGKSTVRLRWAPILGPAIYRVTVLSGDGDVVIEEETRAAFFEARLPVKAKYRWRVDAFHDGEPRRKIAAVDSKGASAADTESFQIDPYVPLELAQGEESSQWYGWARYITSISQYRGSNWDRNSRVRQDIFGGSTELAMGYWSRFSNFGLLGYVGLAGHSVGDRAFFYGRTGIDVGYRHKVSEDSRLRYWLGVSLTETPEVLADASTGSFDVGKLRSAGPDARVTYSKEVSEKMGYQIFASAYYGALALASPNGQTQNPTWVYRGGILATRRFTDRVSGMLGYTYEALKASYPNVTGFSDDNTVSLTGHYLSFFFEFGIEKPKK